jgi:hypothetical protein
MIYGFPKLEQLLYFIRERHHIWKRRFHLKQDGPPWTKDPILLVYKFTNVYRELDRVTLWINAHWRTPYKNEKHLWFAMVVARLVNNTDTLAELSLPGRWNRAQFLKVMARRKAEGLKRFGGAYIVSTGGRAMDKSEYLADYVLDPMWENRAMLCPVRHESLANYHRMLMKFDGMGSFMAAQIVADMKYVQPLKNAKDFWTFASSGPGSRKGMSYVTGISPSTKWREHEWREALSELHALVNPYIARWRFPRLHAQDLQNCLCEFSKYSRTGAGTGRPKAKFIPYGG